MKSNLGAAVKNERSALGISQEELAHRAGLHRTYISDLERGTRNPSVESVEKLAAALQISVSKLFERAGEGDALSKAVVDIVFVEDNLNDIELTLRAFKKANINNPVHVMRDGQQALDFLLRTPPLVDTSAEVVLLDLNLPKISGLDVLARLKADERTKNIPVIVLTASEQDHDINACRRLGCADYIVKPVGFHNFSEITQQIGLEWTLVRNLENQTQGREAAAN